MGESTWLNLLERVRRDIPTLLGDFMEELADLDGYSGGPVPRDDLERTALQAFDLFLERLSADDGEAAASDFPGSLGRRRARQGIRIDQFTEGVRINFRLLWRALHRAAEPDLVGELVSNGERVLNVVERYATEVQAAFIDETQIMAQFHRTARERALARLFAGGSDEADVRGAAEVLGLERDETYELITAKTAEVPEAVRAPLSEQGALTYEDGDLLHLFRRRRGVADWPLASRGLAGVHIARVAGLGTLARAASLARDVLRVAEPGRTVTLRDGFAPLMRERVREAVEGFEHELLGDWRRATSDERQRFSETLHVFMRSGSVQETADRLFLHRNTVFKRLRAFEALTGLDVTRPRDAAIALLLLPTDPAVL
ncbi:PucR family transcriptional regulator [Leucobacter muris]|jgi:hypothetical protein|uniref:PucR family transcriptional regulator n=1 Tax=Leucobacter muris TaxID=1935379 RepID=A0ABX5QG84_9MICO|nr:PucR family transcriptional regulator [Leucobacter muris]QAB17979.1 PucR family transcriptional regulator [Leucobacter muris]